MKILITGSSGFIGSHLTTALAADGHRVAGFDVREPTGDHGLIQFFRGDLRDGDSLAAALEGVECVINLAAVHFDSGHTDEEYFETNEGGTRVLLQAMDDAGVKKHIFASTVAVYGERDEESSEETTPNPSRPYGKSKLAAEGLIHQWADEHRRSAVILRPCVVFGERNIANMHNLIRQIESGFFLMFGGGENVKAVAYVGNVVAAIRHCLKRMEPGVATFNYADKPDLSVNEIVSIICDELGTKRLPFNLPLWMGILAAVPFEALSFLIRRPLPVTIARVKKLSTATRFAAQKIRDNGVVQEVDTEEGLRRMVRFYVKTKMNR